MENLSTPVLAGKSHKNASGIYQITNTINGKIYIGSAVHFYSRWMNHLSSLRRGLSNCRLLQNAWNKYGESAFKIQVLLICEKEELIHYEALFIELTKANDRRHGYNIAKAGNRIGCLHTPETKARISKAKAGKKLTAEHRAKISAGNLGKVVSEETKAKIRIPKSAGTRSRMSDAQKTSVLNQPSVGGIKSEGRKLAKRSNPTQQRQKGISGNARQTVGSSER